MINASLVKALKETPLEVLEFLEGLITEDVRMLAYYISDYETFENTMETEKERYADLKGLYHDVAQAIWDKTEDEEEEEEEEEEDGDYEEEEEDGDYEEEWPSDMYYLERECNREIRSDDY